MNNDNILPSAPNDSSSLPDGWDGLTIEQKADCFDALIKNLPDSITVKDSSGHYLLVNSVWTRQRGSTVSGSLSDKTDHDFFEPTLADKFKRKDRHVLRHGEPQISTMEKTEENGEYGKRVAMTRIAVIDRKTGTATAVINISKDTSTRTGIEKDLASERDMLLTLLNHSRDAIYFKDLNCRYLRISIAHPAMKFLSTPAQAIGKSDFDYFSSEHADQTLKDEKRIIETGEPILGIIEHESGPGIPERWVFTSKLPMYNNNDDIIGTFGLSRDITDIKKYENELHAAKNKLEDRVKERTKDLQSANMHLKKRIEQLDFLTTSSYEMAHCTELESLAAVILKAFTTRLHITVGALCIKYSGHFNCIGNTAIIGDNQIPPAFFESAVLQLHLSEISSVTVISNWRDYLPPSLIPPQLQNHSNFAAIPFLADNRQVGLLILFTNEDATRDRFVEEEKVLLTLATQGAVSISNALYYKELEEKAQLQAELDAARSIQQRLTPRFTPDIPCIKLKGLYSPAYEVGGDYLDYFKNDAGCWVVVIADVCGKGIPAALLMTLLRSAFRVEARHETSARNLLCAVNTSMQSNLDDRSFVTALCLIINPNSTSMSYARAGHPRLTRLTPANGSVDVIQSDGIALGILPDRQSFYNATDELEIPLHNGEHYFIYTDGLTEAFDPGKNTYGNNRLLSLLSQFNGNSPDALIKSVTRDIRLFTRGAPYHDDLTLIAFSVHRDNNNL